MTFLLQNFMTCNPQCRAQEQCALLIVHSGNDADGNVLKTAKPLTRINQVSGSVCIRATPHKYQNLHYTIGAK